MIERFRMKKMMLLLITGSLLCCITIVGTQAFLVKRSDGIKTPFFPGSVKVALTGCDWETGDEERLLPGETLPFIPIVENKGDLDTWVFVKMSIPVEDIICVDSDTCRKTERKDTEIISFNIAENWEQIQRQGREHQMEYIFGYRQKLSSGETTTPVLKKIQMVNYLEGQLTPETKRNFSIEAIAIQGNITREGEGVREAYRYMTGGETL